jgi:hypothetical protein
VATGLAAQHIALKRIAQKPNGFTREHLNRIARRLRDRTAAITVVLFILRLLPSRITDLPCGFCVSRGFHSICPALLSLYSNLWDAADVSAEGQARRKAARQFLTDIHVPSPSLTKFWGRPVSLRAWVLVPPNYDSNTKQTWPVAFMCGTFSANRRLRSGARALLRRASRHRRQVTLRLNRERIPLLPCVETPRVFSTRHG